MEDKNLQEWKAKASAVLDDIKNQVEGSDVATEVRSQMARMLGEVKKMEKEQQEAASRSQSGFSWEERPPYCGSAFHEGSERGRKTEDGRTG